MHAVIGVTVHCSTLVHCSTENGFIMVAIVRLTVLLHGHKDNGQDDGCNNTDYSLLTPCVCLTWSYAIKTIWPPLTLPYFELTNHHSKSSVVMSQESDVCKYSAYGVLDPMSSLQLLPVLLPC